MFTHIDKSDQPQSKSGNETRFKLMADAPFNSGQSKVQKQLLMCFTFQSLDKNLSSICSNDKNDYVVIIEKTFVLQKIVMVKKL